MSNETPFQSVGCADPLNIDMDPTCTVRVQMNPDPFNIDMDPTCTVDESRSIYVILIWIQHALQMNPGPFNIDMDPTCTVDESGSI